MTTHSLIREKILLTKNEKYFGSQWLDADPNPAKTYCLLLTALLSAVLTGHQPNYQRFMIFGPIYSTDSPLIVKTPFGTYSIGSFFLFMSAYNFEWYLYVGLKVNICCCDISH